MPLSPDSVWLISGCSTGFGRELAELVLARGWRAVVTARDAARVADLVEGVGERALALSLDVPPWHMVLGAFGMDAVTGRRSRSQPLLF